MTGFLQHRDEAQKQRERSFEPLSQAVDFLEICSKVKNFCDRETVWGEYKTEVKMMKLIHYQTLEPVNPEELRALSQIRNEYNAGRAFNEKIKLWRKSDILDGIEPKDARWGFVRVQSDDEKLQVKKCR